MHRELPRSLILEFMRLSLLILEALWAFALNTMKITLPMVTQAFLVPIGIRNLAGVTGVA